MKLILPGIPFLIMLYAPQVILDEDGFGLQPEMAGLLMAQHYIRFQTMIGMLQIGQGASMADLLWVIANSEELSVIVLRRSEKKVWLAVQLLAAEWPSSSAASACKLLLLLNSALHKRFVVLLQIACSGRHNCHTEQGAARSGLF